MMEKIICIYKIICLSTGKVYMGQTINYEQRRNSYSRLECKGQTKLYNSLTKHGWDNHKMEIIEICHEELLNEKEIYWGNLYEVLDKNKGLNIKELGVGGKWGKEMIHKFKEKRNTPEWKLFMSSIQKGKVTSAETKTKMSISKIGYKQPEETIIKRGVRNKQNELRIKNRVNKNNKPIIFLNENKLFESIKKASNELKIDHSIIIKILKGKKENYKGMKFIYLESSKTFKQQ